MTPPGALRPGARFAPGYRVIEHLARSRVLDVYDAWSEERRCRVALKTPRPDRNGDGRARRALIREGRLLAELTHPHIVRAYETLRGPRCAVVLETLGGETVAHLLQSRSRRLSSAELGFLGLHLCSAISYLHSRGVLHLDVKPSNVVADNGRAKLIDLSVARAPGPCKPGLGTWCYMPPEQARGGVVGPPADLWGIGGLLFEAAAGECAFGGEAVDDGHELPQLARRAAPVRRLRRGLPDALASAIDACLDPEPARRPSIALLAEACEAAARLPGAERRFGAAA